ncbi:major tail protein [Sutcliffiella horikoshii]|uniref:Phage tail protein n=1 Tax=Sutcliffiella horikoshii TaxID=79883 RepID=A0A5D4TFD6_9BACI|nr:major tail protein [Sutcliffiella horikoshii]TYS74520.1 phage tail protein [Sutcliffiella horikoshii]
MENKVTFGLQDVHFATFSENEGVITYDTPKRIPGAVEISLEPKGDTIEHFADNHVYYSAPNNMGYEGTLSISNIPQDFLVSVLGEELDETDSVLTEKANAQTKPFSLMFQFEGDQKAVRHVLYNCTANRPTVASSTKSSSAEPNTNELTFVASPRPNDLLVRRKTTAITPANVYDAWYSAVYEAPVTP